MRDKVPDPPEFEWIANDHGKLISGPNPPASGHPRPARKWVALASNMRALGTMATLSIPWANCVGSASAAPGGAGTGNSEHIQQPSMIEEVGRQTGAFAEFMLAQ